MYSCDLSIYIGEAFRLTIEMHLHTAKHSLVILGPSCLAKLAYFLRSRGSCFPVVAVLPVYHANVLHRIFYAFMTEQLLHPQHVAVSVLCYLYASPMSEGSDFYGEQSGVLK